MARATDLSEARDRLADPTRPPGSPWAALGAGLLLALSAFGLCGAVVVSAAQTPEPPRATAKPAPPGVAASERRPG